MLENFVELARSRYKDRLDINLSIQGVYAHQKVAPLIFLPFLENSFKYGVSEMLEHAWITIDIVVDNDLLKFKLANGKPAGMAEQAISTGTGLRNVKKRLQMLYPNGHELRIIEDDDAFIVTLTVQLDRNILSEKNEEAHVPVG